MGINIVQRGSITSYKFTFKDIVVEGADLLSLLIFLKILLKRKYSEERSVEVLRFFYLQLSLLKKEISAFNFDGVLKESDGVHDNN